MTQNTSIGRELLEAARFEKHDELKALLKQARGPLLAEKDENQQTALHWAVINNQPAMIDLLLTYHFKKNLPNADYLTPIILAAQLGRWRCVEVFIKHHTSNNTNGLGDVLLYAVKDGQFLIVQQLLNHDAPSNVIWLGPKFTPLHWAVENQDISMIKLLLKFKADQTIKDNFNCSALVRAVDNDAWLCVLALCQPNSLPTKDDLNHALLLAAIANQYQAVSALLRVGADANAKKSDEGRSALHWAVVNNSPELFALLLGSGARIEAYDCDEQTPVHLACQLNKMAVASWFKALGVDTSIKDNSAKKETIGEIAVRLGGKDSFITSIYSPSKEPCPMMVAIAQNKLADIQKLVAEGATLNSRMSANKKTPLAYAIELGQNELVTYLSQQSKGDAMVEKAFLSACRKGQWDSAKAIDNERAMVMQLDEQFNKKLAWYSFSNTDVKKALMKEAITQAEKGPCDKVRLFQRLAQSKTATYRQFIFWTDQPTNTTTLCSERADSLAESRSIRQNAPIAI